MRHCVSRYDSRLTNCWTIKRNLFGMITCTPGIELKGQALAFGSAFSQYEHQAPQLRGATDDECRMCMAEYRVDAEAPCLVAHVFSPGDMILHIAVKNKSRESLSIHHKNAEVLAKANNCCWERRICYEEVLLRVNQESTLTLCSRREKTPLRQCYRRWHVTLKNDGFMLAPVVKAE